MTVSSMFSMLATVSVVMFHIVFLSRIVALVASVVELRPVFLFALSVTLLVAGVVPEAKLGAVVPAEDVASESSLVATVTLVGAEVGEHRGDDDGEEREGEAEGRHFGDEEREKGLKTMTNWRWNPSKHNFIADFLQYDSGSSSGEKLSELQLFGADFVDVEHLRLRNIGRCNTLKSANPGLALPAEMFLKQKSEPKSRLGWSISAWHEICELIIARFPSLEKFLISQLLPYYAFYAVI
ncbi:hypothetical protein L596_016402 [Steinernema carpocapsae]|uniref:Uncharacterized protein n=1 Tax=Steinernema carpocapsae TaxID=34508 RepID=A0A4U5NHV9_STECR|nr:hypothetical protein L596_016402 [Steinernema carpocapsae]